MLQKFAVMNYRGFQDRIELDLTHPREYDFNTNVIKDGIIKNGIIYGPNGSGKSNFGLAIFDIVNHLSQKWKKPDYYNNFVFAGRQSDPVSFEYTLQFNGTILQYNYSKDKRGALQSEELFVNNALIFKRTMNTFELDKAFPMDETVKRNILNNANNMSILSYLWASYPLDENHYLLQLQAFINSMLWFRCLESREFIGLENTVSVIDEYIIQNDLIKDFTRFLKNVSGQEFNFAPSQPHDKQLFCYINGRTVHFNTIASTGTHSLTLLYYWITKMQKASFVFIDEFDAFYHFKLSFAVCKQLFDLTCQIFLSSHNTYLMTNDLLRPDCNFILNCNKIKPLCDCTDKDLRFGHNIEKLFRGGTFEI